MTERIRTLVKRISETRPVQTARRQALLEELRALRRDLDARAAPEQAHSLDAALLLMEFMSRSEDVATAETLAIVAGLVGTLDERNLRRSPQPAPAPAASQPQGDVTQHRDLRMTQDYLLGSLLVQAGVVSKDSLTRALQLHTSSGLALGQCLIQLGAASPQQIAAAVAFQDRVRDGGRTARAEPERAAAPRHDVRSTPQHDVRSTPQHDLRMTDKQHGFVQSMHNQVLGEVLIRLGAITREQLERALQVQRAANVHIGEALVETGATNWDQIKRALEVQKQLRRAA